MSMVKFLNEIKEPKVSELGGKGYSLTVLINNQFNVPKGFIIASDSFFEYLRENNLIEKVENLCSEINGNNFQEKSKKIKKLILDGKVSKKIALEIKTNLARLDVQYVSIRSSAVSEDSLKASFAGLHDTFLNIKTEPNLVLENVKECWASLFNERAVIYRIMKEIPHLEGMAVVVQEMIPAEVSGITFTVHPTDKRNLLVEASYGIGDMIVGGKVEPDNYLIERKTLEVKEKNIGDKSKMSFYQSGKIKVVNVEDDARKVQVMSDVKLRENAETCLRIETIFGCPQDVEWAISNNKLWLLQSRSITGR